MFTEVPNQINVKPIQRESQDNRRLAKQKENFNPDLHNENADQVKSPSSLPHNRDSHPPAAHTQAQRLVDSFSIKEISGPSSIQSVLSRTGQQMLQKAGAGGDTPAKAPFLALMNNMIQLYLKNPEIQHQMNDDMTALLGSLNPSTAGRQTLGSIASPLNPREAASRGLSGDCQQLSLPNFGTPKPGFKDFEEYERQIIRKRNSFGGLGIEENSEMCQIEYFKKKSPLTVVGESSEPIDHHRRAEYGKEQQHLSFQSVSELPFGSIEAHSHSLAQTDSRSFGGKKASLEDGIGEIRLTRQPEAAFVAAGGPQSNIYNKESDRELESDGDRRGTLRGDEAPRVDRVRPQDHPNCSKMPEIVEMELEQIEEKLSKNPSSSSLRISDSTPSGQSLRMEPVRAPQRRGKETRVRAQRGKNQPISGYEPSSKRRLKRGKGQKQQKRSKRRVEDPGNPDSSGSEGMTLRPKKLKFKMTKKTTRIEYNQGSSPTNNLPDEASGSSKPPQQQQIKYFVGKSSKASRRPKKRATHPNNDSSTPKRGLETHSHGSGAKKSIQTPPEVINHQKPKINKSAIVQLSRELKTLDEMGVTLPSVKTDLNYSQSVTENSSVLQKTNQDDQSSARHRLALFHKKRSREHSDAPRMSCRSPINEVVAKNEKNESQKLKRKNKAAKSSSFIQKYQREEEELQEFFGIATEDAIEETTDPEGHQRRASLQRIMELAEAAKLAKQAEMGLIQPGQVASNGLNDIQLQSSQKMQEKGISDDFGFYETDPAFNTAQAAARYSQAPNGDAIAIQNGNLEMQGQELAEKTQKGQKSKKNKISKKKYRSLAGGANPSMYDRALMKNLNKQHRPHSTFKKSGSKQTLVPLETSQKPPKFSTSNRSKRRRSSRCIETSVSNRLSALRSEVSRSGVKSKKKSSKNFKKGKKKEIGQFEAKEELRVRYQWTSVPQDPEFGSIEINRQNYATASGAKKRRRGSREGSQGLQNRPTEKVYGLPDDFSAKKSQKATQRYLRKGSGTGGGNCSRSGSKPKQRSRYSSVNHDLEPGQVEEGDFGENEPNSSKSTFKGNGEVSEPQGPMIGISGRSEAIQKSPTPISQSQSVERRILKKNGNEGVDEGMEPIDSLEDAKRIAEMPRKEDNRQNMAQQHQQQIFVTEEILDLKRKYETLLQELKEQMTTFEDFKKEEIKKIGLKQKIKNNQNFVKNVQKIGSKDPKLIKMNKNGSNEHQNSQKFFIDCNNHLYEETATATQFCEGTGSSSRILAQNMLTNRTSQSSTPKNEENHTPHISEILNTNNNKVTHDETETRLNNMRVKIETLKQAHGVKMTQMESAIQAKDKRILDLEQKMFTISKYLGLRSSPQAIDSEFSMDLAREFIHLSSKNKGSQLSRFSPLTMEPGSAGIKGLKEPSFSRRASEIKSLNLMSISDLQSGGRGIGVLQVPCLACGHVQAIEIQARINKQTNQIEFEAVLLQGSPGDPQSQDSQDSHEGGCRESSEEGLDSSPIKINSFHPESGPITPEESKPPSANAEKLKAHLGRCVESQKSAKLPPSGKNSILVKSGKSGKSGKSEVIAGQQDCTLTSLDTVQLIQEYRTDSNSNSKAFYYSSDRGSSGVGNPPQSRKDTSVVDENSISNPISHCSPDGPPETAKFVKSELSKEKHPKPPKSDQNRQKVIKESSNEDNEVRHDHLDLPAQDKTVQQVIEDIQQSTHRSKLSELGSESERLKDPFKLKEVRFQDFCYDANQYYQDYLEQAKVEFRAVEIHVSETGKKLVTFENGRKEVKLKNGALREVMIFSQKIKLLRIFQFYSLK